MRLYFKERFDCIAKIGIISWKTKNNVLKLSELAHYRRHR